jgi:hypothetical protein
MKETFELNKILNPEMTFHLYDNDMCREFIKNNFDENVLYSYDKLIPGKYKSELWRYCILYIYGGIYLNINYSLLKNVKLIQLTNNEYYVNGTYNNLAATGGTGNGALLNITVAGGIVTNVQLSYAGSGYTAGETLTATIGSVGSGFATSVGTINNPTGTSWLGDNFDTVLLYGCLVEAYTYMKGEADMMALYNQKYTEALTQLNRLGTGLERGDAYRDGQAKIKVNP